MATEELDTRALELKSETVVGTTRLATEVTEDIAEELDCEDVETEELG